MPALVSRASVLPTLPAFLVPARGAVRQRITRDRPHRPKAVTPTIGIVLPHFISPPGLLKKITTIFTRIRSYFAGVFSARRIRKILGRRAFIDFQGGLRAAYIQLNEALAHGRESDLRKILTEDALENYRHLLEMPRQRDHRYEWTLYELKEPKIVSRLMTRINDPAGGTKQLEFAQLAVLFDTKQSFAVKDAAGKVVAGSAEPRQVTDILVFEGQLKEGPVVWRIIGRIDPVTGKVLDEKDHGERATTVPV